MFSSRYSILPEILKFVNDHKLLLLEDNCDALGSTFDNKLTGSFGIMSSCSFYPAHHLTMGEGGFVACSDENLAITLRSLRDWGRGCYCVGKKANESKEGTCGHRFDYWIKSLNDQIFDHKYVYGEIGYNLKPLELQCCIGLEQIKRQEEFKKRRKNNFEELYSFFKQYEDFFILPKIDDNRKKINWFGFVLTIRNPTKFTRAQICDYYEEHKISTRTFFGGNILLHPAYEGLIDLNDAMNNYPNATKITNDSFYIGLHPSIDNTHISWIKTVTKKFFNSI